MTDKYDTYKALGNDTVSRHCEACNGTGRFQARFGGPDWPLCPECMGTGQNGHRTTLDDRRATMLTRALEKIKAQEELLASMQDEFLAALAALAAATASYKNFTGNAQSRGRRDPLYATKLSDYERAEAQARQAYRDFDLKLAEIKTNANNAARSQ